MRYTVIGVSNSGPLHNDWSQLKTGQMLQITTGPLTKIEAHYLGHDFLGPPIDELGIVYAQDAGVWRAYFYGTAEIIGAGVWAEAQGNLDEVWCTDGYALPVTAFNGPLPAPDFMFFKPLAWYDTSSLPYLGP